MTKFRFRLSDEDTDDIFLEKWSKIRSKGRNKFILLYTLRNGIIVAIILSFGLADLNQKLTWSFYLDKHFWKGFVFLLVFYSIITSFTRKRVWDSSEKRYDELTKGNNS